jgi:hypothetical protein
LPDAVEDVVGAGTALTELQLVIFGSPVTLKTGVATGGALSDPHCDWAMPLPFT